MSSVWRVFKNIVFWSYGRTTWQYDVLCALILAFIFLTPKNWFEQGEPRGGRPHQNPNMAAERLVIRPENLGPTPAREEIERRVREATHRSNIRVKGWRALRAGDGRLAAYEVDIE